MRVDPTSNITHAVVVAGWDKESESYLLLDPMQYGRGPARPAKELYGANWNTKIAQAFTVEVTGGSAFSADVQMWIHSPLEAVVIDPIGRQAGYDASTGLQIRVPGRNTRRGSGQPARRGPAGDSTRALTVGGSNPGLYASPHH
jgi:hypothetical protein